MQGAADRFSERIGQIEVVLIEQESRRRAGAGRLWQGRTDTNRRAVLPALPAARGLAGGVNGGAAGGGIPPEVQLEAGLAAAREALDSYRYADDLDCWNNNDKPAGTGDGGVDSSLWAGCSSTMWDFLAAGEASPYSTGAFEHPGYAEGDLVAVLPIRSNSRTLFSLPLCVVGGGPGEAEEMLE